MTSTPDTPSIVTVFGWELHFAGGGSDKFYRVLIIDTLALINYGRRGGAGQFVAHSRRTTASAQQKARELTNAKADKGYQLTRDMTSFTVPAAAVTELVSLSPGMHRVGLEMCSTVIARFKDQATAQGTAMSTASG